MSHPFTIDKEKRVARAKYETFLIATGTQLQEMAITGRLASVPGPIKIDIPEIEHSGMLLIPSTISFAFDSMKDYTNATVFSILPGMKLFELDYVVDDGGVLSYFLNFFKGTDMGYSDIIRGFIAAQEANNFILDFPLGLTAAFFAELLKTSDGKDYKRFSIQDPDDHDFKVERLKRVPLKAGTWAGLTFENTKAAITSGLARDVGKKVTATKLDSPGTSLQEKLVFYQNDPDADE